jgi:hypothetical protein
MSTDSITLQVVKNGGAPATGAVTATFSDSIVLGLGSSASGVRKVKYRIYEFPAGFALPVGWTQDAVNVYSVTVQNGADAPAFSLPASGNDLRGKYFFDAVANDQLSNGRITGSLRSKAQAKIPLATAGLEDVGFQETNEFDNVRQWIGPLKKLIRILDQAVLSGGGVTAHGALTGLSADDHSQYEFARRPLTGAYTAASNDAALADSRACIITARATAISLRIRLQSAIPWLSETLLGGINTGAGTLTLTAEAGVTLNGSVTVPQNGWWWGKRTASNTWQMFTGGTGGGGTGDFKADGSVAMTGDLDLGAHKVVNGADAVASTGLTTLQQVIALIASAVTSAGGGGGDGFRFTYSANTTDADPGAGTFRANDTIWSSVTTLYVDLAEFGGTDITAWIDSLDDEIGAVKGRLRITSIADPTKWLVFKLTGWTTATGYRKLTVAYVDGPGGISTTAGDTFLSFDALGMGQAIVNPDVSVTAGIAGTKIAPDFGPQHVVQANNFFLFGRTFAGVLKPVVGVTVSDHVLLGTGTGAWVELADTTSIVFGVNGVPRFTLPASGAAFSQLRWNAAGTALEFFSPPAPVVGADLTNANATKNISDGSQFTLPASTLATSAKTLTLGTSGTPELDEVIEVIVYGQSQNYVLANGGPLADTLYTVVAGTKRVLHAKWNGTDWRPAGKIRLT